MNDTLGVSPIKGNQGTTQGKEKIFSSRWEQRFDSHRGQKIIPFTRANIMITITLMLTLTTTTTKMMMMMIMIIHFLYCNKPKLSVLVLLQMTWPQKSTYEKFEKR